MAATALQAFENAANALTTARDDASRLQAEHTLMEFRYFS